MEKTNNVKMKKIQDEPISQKEQMEIILKAITKFGNLDAVGKWSGVQPWLLRNVLKGNEIRGSQYEKMVWMKKRLSD
jgi:hypothetical protein